MRIVRLDVRRVSMRLDEPYAIAYETVDTAENLFVDLVTDGPLVGRGCAAPDAAVTGESLADAEAALCDVAAPLLRGEDPLLRTRLTELLRREIPDRPSARAAVDLALHDLLGQVAGLPVWKLLGGFREGIATSVTVGILPVAETVERARRWLADGFRCLKLKGGRDVDDDVARVIAVREAVGGGVELRFDANQGYTREQALHFVRSVRSADLAILEQPTPAGRPELLGEVAGEVALPVMADESLLGLRDAFRIAAEGLADMVNVKLMKIGGLTPALHVDSVARVAGLEAMVGCMDEAALGIAAGLHFALARPNVEYADLDGHIGLVGDPSAGAVIVRDGVLYPREDPGLGWRPARSP